MNKEEILAASRRKHRNQDVTEAEYLKQAEKPMWRMSGPLPDWRAAVVLQGNCQLGLPGRKLQHSGNGFPR